MPSPLSERIAPGNRCLPRPIGAGAWRLQLRSPAPQCNRGGAPRSRPEELDYQIKAAGPAPATWLRSISKDSDGIRAAGEMALNDRYGRPSSPCRQGR